MENSSQGLTLLDPDRKVVVTGEERHQRALVGYAPRGDGRPRRVAVELCLTRAGRIEVRLDGRRVGELTELMSRRYGPHIHAVLRRGGRPGAVALVVAGRRGVEVELRLPDVESDAPNMATSPVPPVGPPSTPPARPRRGLRTPLLIGGGVVALLVAIVSSVGGGTVGGGNDRSTSAAAALPSVPSVARTPTPAPTRPPTTIDTPEPSPIPSPAVVRPTQTRETAPEPVRAAPEPEPRVDPPPAPPREPQPVEPQPVAAPAPSGCHPSYSPCLPDGPDLDCGDIDGPVQVTGPDEYRLDRDDDGVGCES